MNQTTETNTYIETPVTTTPLHFWRNKLTWRTTSTGMNDNVIGTYAPKKDRKEAILHMRINTTPYTDKRKYLDQESKKKHNYFVEVVNDCMKGIWSGGRGFVFTDCQLKEVMRILPTVDVGWNNKDECYYCRK